MSPSVRFFFFFVVVSSLLLGRTSLAAQAFCSEVFTSHLSYHYFFNPTSESLPYQYSGRVEAEVTRLEALGYKEALRNDVVDGGVRDALFIIRDFEVARNPVAFEFVTALQLERVALKKIYNLSDNTYFELSRLTLGILEVETFFGRSPKYHLKENLPEVVSLLKWVLRGKQTPNSRGLTQIKIVPEAIARYYGVKKEDLADPYVAAIATMGYLAEALPWLRNLQRKYNPDSMNPENFYDHLIYIYSGRVIQILQNTSTPERNIYISRMVRRKSSLGIFYTTEPVR